MVELSVTLMSELHDIAADVVAERAAWTTDPVTHLRTGRTITAEIDGSPDPLIVTTELGEDYRNVVIIHVTDDDEAALLNPQDKIRFSLFGRTTIAQILRRRDNPANVQNDFWAQCLTNKDQA